MSDPKVKTSDPKVKTGESQVPRKPAPKRPVDVSSPAQKSPAAKRKRKPAEHYQSDVIDACSKQIRSSSDSKREVFLPKGVYVAVRSEDGFYLCQVLHYVYDDSVGLINIQWMEQKKNGVYELAYMDSVDKESVLTEVKLNSGGERGLKILPASEKERIDKILGFSLQKEKGLLEGVDSSNLAEAVAASMAKQHTSDTTSSVKKTSTSSHKNSSVQNGRPAQSTESSQDSQPTRQLSRRFRGSRKTPEGNQQQKAVVKLKHLKPVVKLRRIEERRRKRGKVGAQDTSTSVAQQQQQQQPHRGARHSTKSDKDANKSLRPKPNIALVPRDQMFEVRNEKDIPRSSKLLLCKKAIRAVLTNNPDLLQQLIDDRDHVHSVFVNRSVDVQDNALLCAMKLNNHKAFEMLVQELFSSENRVNLECPVLDKSQPKRFSYVSMGHKSRPVMLSRGAKEGNYAFAKDLTNFNVYGEPYLNIVQFALRNNVDLNFLIELASRDPAVITELHQNVYIAIRAGHCHLAWKLIETCLEKESFHGFNKFHAQVLVADKPESIPPANSTVIKKKASDNAKITPFHCAAINPNAKILAHLLTFFAGDTLTDQHGWTPLHYAAACAGPAPLALLLSRGVTLETATCKGLTPLMIACKLGRIQNVLQLLKPSKAVQPSSPGSPQNIEKKDNNGYTALHFAAENGHVDVCRLLAKHGAELDSPSSPSTDKVTPLMLAARKGHYETAHALVELGCYMEARDKSKRTPLTHAVMNGHEPITAFLLRKGADPNSLDSSHHTPLHYASGYGWWYCVKLLLQAGADTKILNDSKVPPHWIAYIKGHMECVELLLNQPGTDVNIRDSDGWTLVMMTVKYELTPSTLHHLNFLVEERKADVMQRDANGWNALHHLASNTAGQLEASELQKHEGIALQMANILIRNGCSPSALTTSGDSALSIAVKQKHLNSSLIHCLIENGAQLSLEPNENGENILHAMSRGIKEGSQAEMFDFLSEMLRKPELKKETPVSSKLSTPVKVSEETSQAPDLKDAPSASIAQMPVLEQEANHVQDKVIPEMKSQEPNSKLISETKDVKLSSGNNAPFVNCERSKDLSQNNSGQDQIGPKVLKIAQHAKEEAPVVTPMDVDEKLGASQQGTVGPIAQLVQLAAARDVEGYTPLHRLFQEYKLALNSGGRKNLTEDVLKLMKGFVEGAKSDINAKTDVRNSQNDIYSESRSCLHILVHCNEKPKGSKNARTTVLEEFLKYKPDLNVLNVPSKKTALMEAICEKIYSAVDLLLDAGVDLNFKSPVLLAARMSELPLVTKLVRRGADVRKEDPVTKDSAVHYISSCTGDPREVCSVLKDLLDVGADINARNALKRTPLHLAVNAHSGKADGSSQVVEFLLDHGADPLAQDSTGSIPLHIAFSKYPSIHNDNKAAVDPIEVVCALTAAMKNEKIDTPDNNGNTPLHRAAQHGATISCMHLIKRVPNINAKNVLDNTPLNLAVSMKQEGTTIALLQNDTVDVTNPLKVRARKYAEWEQKMEKFNKYWQWELMKPWQPLKTFNFSLISQVVQRQWHGVLFLLMDHLERAGLSKTAVVEAAIDESRFQLALNLLSKIKDDKDVQAVNSQGQNLLHILMYIMPTKTTALHLEVGRELLKRGVGLGLDKHQCSPLTYAALDQSAEFCKMLIDHKREECIQLLRSTDVKGRSPLAAVFWRLDNDMQQLEATLKFLLECGISVDQNMPLPRRDLILQEPEMDPDDFYLFWDGPVGQFSPLIGAILARDKSMVKLLLDLGADPNFADPDNVTPLMHAVRMNDLSIIKLLFGLNEKDEPRPLKRQSHSSGPAPPGSKEFRGGKTEGNVWRDNSNKASSVSTDGDKMEVGSEPWLDYFPRNISVLAVDKYGRTAVHYLVSTCDYGTYENDEILNFFAKCKIPLDTKDSSGKTVLDYARELHLEKMVKNLRKLLNIKEEVSLSQIPVEVRNEPPPHRFDFKADADKMLEKLKSQEMETSTTSDESDTGVDPDSGCTGGEVLRDNGQDIPYSVFLTVVDIKQGVYGMNAYYKMQIINMKEKGKQVFMLFTKSGRIGTVGQHQCTPYNAAESAIEEFQKIFRAKTGHFWSQYKEFKPIRGKHRVVKSKFHYSKRHPQKLQVDPSACPPSKLPASQKALMTEITQQRLLESVQASCHVDMALMPFGRLQGDILQQAKGVLEAIRGLLSDYKKEDCKGTDDIGRKHSRMQDIMEKVSDLTLEYYQLIPCDGFTLSAMQPLHTMENLQQAQRDTETLIELELAGKILLGAQYHHSEMNVLDYTYGAIECSIDLLERSSKEAQLILQQIASSGRDVYKNVNIEAIYKLTRRNEERRMAALNLDNHKLLWHGTKSGNLLSILKEGLQKSSSEVTSTGIILGEGIHLSDTFSRALQYCDVYQKKSRVKFMLLCEVALGKEYIPEKADDVLVEGFHHIKGEGSLYPDPRFDLRLPSGVVISMGKLIQGKSSLQYNEFVVQNASQVCLRYLLQFNQDDL